MTYAVPSHTKHSKDCLYHIEQEQVDCDCGGNMTDHSNSLLFPTPTMQFLMSENERLLSRVRELEAAYALCNSNYELSRAEELRLRAILDAPVTDEEGMAAYTFKNAGWGPRDILEKFLAARRSK
jgi:hypothetical protein